MENRKSDKMQIRDANRVLKKCKVDGQTGMDLVHQRKVICCNEEGGFWGKFHRGIKRKEADVLCLNTGTAHKLEVQETAGGSVY